MNDNEKKYLESVWEDCNRCKEREELTDFGLGLMTLAGILLNKDNKEIKKTLKERRFDLASALFGRAYHMLTEDDKQEIDKRIQGC